MFFQDHEKTIYSPRGSDQKFDPLTVERQLRIVSGGALGDLLADCRAGFDDQGDISFDPERKKEIDRTNAVTSARAEEALVRIAREVFRVADFPVGTDAHALEILYDYLEWMQGKGVREPLPPT